MQNYEFMEAIFISTTTHAFIKTIQGLHISLCTKDEGFTAIVENLCELTTAF